MRKVRVLWLLLAVLSVMTGCQLQDGRLFEMTDDTNAVYYWRTELRLDSAELAFLTQYNIKKVYCRYFDVVIRDSMPMPNATISFTDRLPDSVQLVPTVYITEECMHQRHDDLAEKVVRRIRQINETNDLPPFRELQIDCDYTLRSRQTYYDFLGDIKAQLEGTGCVLSTTIRLHQLQMKIPPVDYGVLMIYNTGDPRRFMERRSADGRLLEEGRNPILDMRDVEPYLHGLARYPLPLAAAYPVYRWQRNIYGVRVEHTVEANEILKVKEAVEKERHELRRTIVTYHLDEENINRYTPETYEKIYSH
jgi:hypothetical protein